MNQKLLKFMNKNSNPNTPNLNSRNSSSQLTKIKSKHPSKNSIEPSSKTAINEEPQSKITPKSTDPIQKSSENQNPETINLQNILTDESNQVLTKNTDNIYLSQEIIDIARDFRGGIVLASMYQNDRYPGLRIDYRAFYFLRFS